jgi:RNA polymerase sigma-70 factor (ECF subfamily)
MAEPSPVQHSDPDLVARIRAGDERAFEALFREYYKPLRRYAITIVHRPDVAEDIVQAVFLSLWTGRHEWVLRSSLKAYLYSAVHHRALQLLRHERVRDRHVIAVLEGGDWTDASPPASGPDAQVADQELSQLLQSVIEGLAPRTRQAFELQRYHQLSYAEIAGVMGISVKTVGVHIGRALALLRKAMLPSLMLYVLVVL